MIDFENIFSFFWFIAHDYIVWIMSLVFLLVLGIIFYEWFKFKE